MAEGSLQTILDGLPNGVDHAVLGALATELTLPTLLIMLEAFVEELGDNDTTVREAIATKDFSAIERIAHTTKSTAGTFGATDLYTIALDTESAAQAAETALVEQKAREMLQEISFAKERFQSIIEQVSAE